MRTSRFLAGLAFLALLTGANGMDPENPSCPAKPQWGPATAMTLTKADRDGRRVLIADGIVDSTLPARLKAAIDADDVIGEVWLRSRGGDGAAEAPRVPRPSAPCGSPSR